MRKLLFAVFTLLSVASIGQISYANPQPSLPGIQYQRIKSFKVQPIPRQFKTYVDADTTPHLFYHYDTLYQRIGGIATPVSAGAVDTLHLSNRINLKLNISDTATMLSNRLKISDTATMLSNRLKISDTSAMLAGYSKTGRSVQYADTASMLSNRLKISDTTYMLSGYLKKQDTVNRFIWNQNGHRLYPQAGKLYLNDTIRTDGTVLSIASKTTSLEIGNNINTLGSQYIAITVPTVSTFRQQHLKDVDGDFIYSVDTSSMLSGYSKTGRTVQYADTASMLSGYAKIGDAITEILNTSANGITINSTGGTTPNLIASLQDITPTSVIASAGITASFFKGNGKALTNVIHPSDTANMLSGYLKLGGGTLTGQLNATSIAANAGITTTTLTASGAITTTGLLSAQGQSAFGTQFGSPVVPGAGFGYPVVIGNNGGVRSLYTYGSVTINSSLAVNDILSVAGAATFLSTLSSTGTITSNGGFSGTLNTATQPNITSVGTLSILTVAGNIKSGGLTTTGTASIGSTLFVNGDVNSTGNVTGTVISGALLSGPLSTAAQPNVTSLGTLSLLTVTNSITGGTILAGGATTPINSNTKVQIGTSGSDVRTAFISSNQFAQEFVTAGGTAVIIGADASGNLIFSNNSGTQIANINQSTGVYTAVSDSSLKNNIEPSGSALSTILKIPIDKYYWKKDNKYEPFGIVAQKLYKVTPAYVYKPSKFTTTWTIAKSEMIPMIIKGEQELNKKIELLEKRIAKLEKLIKYIK